MCTTRLTWVYAGSIGVGATSRKDPPTARAPGRDHLVSFYETDDELTSTLATYFADGVRAGETIIFIATSDHRTAVEAALAAAGHPVPSLDYVALDARITLATFMDGASPDAARYRDVVGLTVAAAIERGRPVRAFGEMVSILWEEGNVTGAIELEHLWNELADEYAFTLLCAYPHSFGLGAAGEDLLGATHVCHQHSAVVGPARYASGSFDVMTASDDVSHVFVPTTAAVSAARRFVGETLRTWGDAALAGDAALVVSELATNSVVHATSAFSVSISKRPDDVRITVRDVVARAPLPPVREPAAVGGLGLVIVDRLTSDWGTELLPDGKAVWCEFVRRD